MLIIVKITYIINEIVHYSYLVGSHAPLPLPLHVPLPLKHTHTHTLTEWYIL